MRIRHRSKSRVGEDHMKSLSVDQKCELVQKELEDTKDEIRHLRANAERDLQYHEVHLSPYRLSYLAPHLRLIRKSLWYVPIIGDTLKETQVD